MGTNESVFSLSWQKSITYNVCVTSYKICVYCLEKLRWEWREKSGSVSLGLLCHCYGLSRSRERKGWNAHGFNNKKKRKYLEFPSNTICKGLQRETHLTLPISYCLSVFLIWSDVGQLPFWARSQDTYWQGDWQLIKLPGIHSPRFFLPAFIYKSQYCYYEYIIGVLRFTYLFHALTVNNVLLILELACIHTKSAPKLISLFLHHMSRIFILTHGVTGRMGLFLIFLLIIAAWSL